MSVPTTLSRTVVRSCLEIPGHFGTETTVKLFFIKTFTHKTTQTGSEMRSTESLEPYRPQFGMFVFPKWCTTYKSVDRKGTLEFSLDLLPKTVLDFFVLLVYVFVFHNQSLKRTIKYQLTSTLI